MRLSTLNLNQMVALDVLLAEGHVGRAASRMGVTQSAMSHTLKSLRQLLDDPLLVRVGNSMVLTPLAEEVKDRVRRGLAELESVVNGRTSFDPDSITDTFTLATNDGIASALSAPLFSELKRRAPRASLRIQLVDPEHPLEQLGSGVDVSLLPPFANLSGVATESLEPAGLEVVCRADHPVIKKRVTLSQYCRIPHAMLTLDGEGPGVVDHLLAEHGRERRVEARVPYLISLAEILSSSDLLASVPSPIARFFCSLWPLKRLPLPIPLEPQPVFLCWHPRFEAEPAHRFFREVVRTATRALVRDGRPSFEHSAARRSRGTR